MNSKLFLTYLKSINLKFSKYTLGSVEESVADSICVYKRSGSAGKWEYGKDTSTTYPVSIVYTGTKNYTETENKTNQLFESLAFHTHILVNDSAEAEDFYFSIIPFQRNLPVYLGKNEAGFHQFSIDLILQTY
jgi:hypothetical protein